ncbi:MAG: alpha-amylase [Syntrophobacteraceae bacterium]
MEKADPTVYEVNTWVWLSELGQKYGRRIDLGSVPPQEWEEFARLGVDALWFMGVWERSPSGVRIALELEDQVAEYRRALPDFTAGDVVGSPYCIRRYVTDEQIGGEKGLAAARGELAKRGRGLILDFVPNHTAQDSPWIFDHPEYFIPGDREDLAKDPTAFFEAGPGGAILALGRDPFFPAWQDVAQVNAFHPGLRKASIEALGSILEQCDGVRCDMAMLLTNAVFERTWGRRAGEVPSREFWVEVIEAVRRKHPRALFIAEAYWDMEWELQQQGFDFCYDKRLYDRFVSGTAETIRQHLLADLGYQGKLIRFLENHDEPRAAAVLSPRKERAAAVVIATLPGAKLFHEGQFEGRRVRIPVALSRRPPEELDSELQLFFYQLLTNIDSSCFHDGEWTLCDLAGWPDNWSWNNILAWGLRKGEERYLVAVNFSEFRSQALVQVPWNDIGEARWRLVEVLTGEEYLRDGAEMLNPGLFVDLEAWDYHFLRCREIR